MSKLGLVLFVASGSLFGIAQLYAQQRLSEDRDLKEYNLGAWGCNSLEGTAKTPDGQERNRLKNRSAPPVIPVNIPKLDFAGFLKYVESFDTQTKGKRRKDINGAEKKPLPDLENQIVEMTGYLGIAYAGPPETTNCASVDYHDWHLEIFEKPPENPPKPGSPTAIICEITPRTQNAIFHDGIRIQELAGFFRKTDLSYEPTGHPARKVRITGYLMWDDEHNGEADVGKEVRTAPEKKFHNPWRDTAWEIHPVIQIKPVDEATPTAAAPAPQKSVSPESIPPSPSPSPDAAMAPPTPTPTLAPTPTPTQFLTVTRAVRIKIPYGETVLPAGSRVEVISRSGPNVSVKYLGGTYLVPIDSTDYK